MWKLMQLVTAIGAAERSREEEPENPLRGVRAQVDACARIGGPRTRRFWSAFLGKRGRQLGLRFEPKPGGLAASGGLDGS